MKSGSIDKYPVMKTADICSLQVDGQPVQDITAKDCSLFLWCPWPLLKPDGFQVMEAWGFDYKTDAFLWVKLTSTGRKLFYGLGSHTRGNTEPCLLGIKGHPKRVSKSVPQVVISPIREHSRKPDVVRDRIVELMGDVPRLEMFARERFENWDAWGNEVDRWIHPEQRSNYVAGIEQARLF
jgi:site-specific DNA-methyltransferase (adenine-specific)